MLESQGRSHGPIDLCQECAPSCLALRRKPDSVMPPGETHMISGNNLSLLSLGSSKNWCTFTDTDAMEESLFPRSSKACAYCHTKKVSYETPEATCRSA